MAIDLSRFKETFFQEAAEHLAEMEAGLLRLEVSAADPELLNSIFRSAHSIKGASGTFGFDDISKFTHELESLLDGMRAGRIAPSHELVNLLLHSVDVLGQLLDAARDPAGQQPAPPEMETVLRELAAHREGPPPAAAAAPPSKAAGATATATDGGRGLYEIVFEPAPNLFQLGLDPLLVLRDLARMGEILEVRAELERIPALEDLQPGTCYLGWKLRLATTAGTGEVRDAFAFVEDLATVRVEEWHEHPASGPAVAAGGKPPASSPAARHQSSGTTIRVATEKVDKIIDLVGELVIAQSMATQIINGFTPARVQDLQVAVAELERHTRELQDRVMRIRMLPIGSIFSRFPRLVHDTAEALGKEVMLQISGEETELDKGVVERIADPLTHLIRNAVDHGIESGQERRAAGKPEQGVIRLTAAHQGGNVVVEVSDDGQGLDLARIRSKAVERGLADAGAELTEEQAYSLIFQPGFSTAEEVSDISGRGVGMDVVRKKVEALSGAVGITSQRGRGTSVRIKLPLTLAILDGLCLRVGEQTYILPLATIVESIQPRPDQVKSIAGRGEVVMVRGEPLTMLRLHNLFRVPNAETDPARALLVIVENEGRRLALLVDELLGQQQVVIKSLETHYRKVDGITGATILGDGRAALILDVAGVAQLAKNTNTPCPAERREEIAAA
jgi:two-component system chemotaxis sensor kinase CheA